MIEATDAILAVGDPDHVGPDGKDGEMTVREKAVYLHSLMAELREFFCLGAHPNPFPAPSDLQVFHRRTIA